jgi:hypothetical protein
MLAVVLLPAAGFPSAALASARVVSSEVAPGIQLRSIRRSAPSQCISVISVAPWASVRAVLATAGPEDAPFAKVSSAVDRLEALAGVNGYFTTLPGANPMLVTDGRVVAPPCARQCVRDPRTGFGLREDGSALLVTVDGRQADAAGMGLREFAVLLRELGAVWAVNLDGGASTSMVVGGVLVNRPADPSGERLVATALVLLPAAVPAVTSVVRQLRRMDPRIVTPVLITPASRGFRRAA